MQIFKIQSSEFKSKYILLFTFGKKKKFILKQKNVGYGKNTLF